MYKNVKILKQKWYNSIPGYLFLREPNWKYFYNGVKTSLVNKFEIEVLISQI